MPCCYYFTSSSTSSSDKYTAVADEEQLYVNFYTASIYITTKGSTTITTTASIFIDVIFTNAC